VRRRGRGEAVVEIEAAITAAGFAMPEMTIEIEGVTVIAT
jgi:hypothetical protein